jgi:serine/threonine protein kinase
MIGGMVTKIKNENSFRSLMRMIKNPNCKITCCSYSSLRGFVFKLHIDKPTLDNCDTEFFGMNDSNTAFNLPVNTLIIKMAIITDRPVMLTDYVAVNRKPVDKASETLDSFKNEAKVQSIIYKKTLSNGSGTSGDPVCPAIVDFSLLEHYVALKFLDAVKDKCSADTEATNMIKYMNGYLKRFFGLTIFKKCYLGVITMEMASGYESFYAVSDRIIERNGMNDSLKQTELMKLDNSVILKIIRLYNEAGIVHCDLHGNNVMVKKNDDGTYKVYIIDFGVYVDVNDPNIMEKLNPFLLNDRRYRLIPTNLKKTNLNSFKLPDIIEALRAIVLIEAALGKYKFNVNDYSIIKDIYLSLFDNKILFTISKDLQNPNMLNSILGLTPSNEGKYKQLLEVLNTLNSYYATKNDIKYDLSGYEIINTEAYIRTEKDIDQVIPKCAPDLAPDTSSETWRVVGGKKMKRKTERWRSRKTKKSNKNRRKSIKN